MIRLDLNAIGKTAKATLLFLFMLTVSCRQLESSADNEWAIDSSFRDYWYQGKAEISTYKLQQARYGSMHQGKAVLIFVTEDFSAEKHVKLDNPAQAGSDAVKVMKLNKVKNFTTGIYPYTMMTSVFTPVQQNPLQHSLKVTTTSQEWCGHTFTQMDLQGDQITARLFSYFESEGDQQISLEKTWMEDELWNLIRINPEQLPTGNLTIIPGTMYQRLSHQNLEVSIAQARLTEQGDQRVYSLTYPESDRTLVIRFEKKFPYQILSWEDSYPSGFGENAQILTTKATLDKSLMTDYWTKNSPEDSVYRKELNLE